MPDAAGGVFNVGSGVATTVNEVVAALFAAFGTEVPTRVSGNYRLGDIRHNIADTTRLREILGYSPAVGLPRRRRALRRVGAHRADRGRQLRALARGDGVAEPAEVSVPAALRGTPYPYRKNSLNLFRLILAALVLFAHSWYITGQRDRARSIQGENLGGWAVAGFFVLSGFLITRSRLRTSPGEYLLHRVARIYPAFVVVLVVTAFVVRARSRC